MRDGGNFKTSSPSTRLSPAMPSLVRAHLYCTNNINPQQLRPLRCIVVSRQQYRMAPPFPLQHTPDAAAGFVVTNGASAYVITRVAMEHSRPKADISMYKQSQTSS
ncbi:hypothetical protein ACN38_g7261 [Penicillium nordicum]|uniref:Uncharacterized protein n=1 Tax=Penicillium nordicum TaxID=229535 RepID=A0A0M8NZ63_9EURO|nr:hypothetical protein ACN38_g7261 [Penicillium nordicum]